MIINNQMLELENLSIRLKHGDVIMNAYGYVYFIKMAEFSDHEQQYARNNGVMAFVVNGELFVTAITKSAISTLEENGFILSSFSVPMSKDDYPLEKATRWAEICDYASKINEIEFKSECAKYAYEHKNADLFSDLRGCMKIPEYGFPTQRDPSHGEYGMYFPNRPLVKKNIFDPILMDQFLGTYDSYDGYTMFVNTDGETYLTVRQDVVELLKGKGFSWRSYRIPLTCGDRIVGPDNKRRWKAYVKAAAI